MKNPAIRQFDGNMFSSVHIFPESVPVASFKKLIINFLEFSQDLRFQYLITMENNG